MIPPTINTHIDCQKNSKSVFGAFSKQQQGALKVCCASYSVSMNCCQHYMLHINLHILYIYFIKLNFNLKEVQESNNYFKSYQVNNTRYYIELHFNFNLHLNLNMKLDFQVNSQFSTSLG